MEKIVLLTTCTNRKRREIKDDLLARHIAEGPIDRVAESWVARLRNAPFSENIEAGDLYAGRGFREACYLGHNIGGRLMIISAGCGLISKENLVPPYGLTITSKSEDAIQQRVVGEMISPADWWRVINEKFHTPSPITHMIRNSPNAIFVFALSSAYFQLIAEDLLQLSEAERAQIRITGLRPTEKISRQLSPFCMPYDNRLDGPDSPIPGTRGDFPQRCMRHFVEEIYFSDPNGTPADHKNAVSSCLDDLREPAIISRTPKTDDELISIIRANMDAVDGQSSKMLRYLRDSLQVACEQKRFQGLFRRAAGEMS